MSSTQPTTKNLKDLQRIPGVGPVIAGNLWDMGYQSVDALKDQDPEDLYWQLCDQRGEAVDRCALYVLRCAVYFASHQRHTPEKLRWWYWKDHA
jgi:hypothetical protein